MTKQAPCSALVVAHPDDEALWFSSVVRRVGHVYVAFEACADFPHLGAARRAARAEFPLSNVTFFGLDEPCSLSWVDWERAEPSTYGLTLNRPGAEEAEGRYRESFAALRRRLATELAGANEVYTHGPWGEYGHPDHVQLCRAVQSLAPELGFRTLYPAYVAPRSAALAARYLPWLRPEATLDCDLAAAAELKAVYERHGCWTWSADYAWPRTETFLTESPSPLTWANTLPLTCLVVT